ncbi:hypothetical protein QBC43DRAFT_288238 [Cladorrhinum sp. PSN259]|nr:hypothetical protein QBC43DRAFT_288238 [Cladorrhinum sp. PSN259]
MEATNTSAGLSEVAGESENPNDPSDVTFVSKLSGRIVKVVVGREKHHCFIHEFLLCSVSEFFLKAFSGPFKESDGVLELPEDKPAVFEIFLKWLYLTASGGRYPESVHPINLEDDLVLHLEVYVFADRFVINDFKEDIFRTVLLRLGHGKEHNLWLASEVHRVRSDLIIALKAKYLHYVFENTTESDKMRRKEFDDVGKAHPDFASFLLKALVKWEKCMNDPRRWPDEDEIQLSGWYDEEGCDDGMGEEDNEREGTDESDSSSNSD